MKHFVAYQNEDKWGEFVGSGSWFTARSFHKDTLVGNRLWAVVGRGKPRQYLLADSGVIYDVVPSDRPEAFRTPGHEKGLSVLYHSDFARSIDVTSESWFRRLRETVRNFSLGLTSVATADVVRSLELLLSGDAVADVAEIEGRSALRPTEKKALIDARLGQGGFRAALLNKWDGTCAVNRPGFAGGCLV